jgi:AraC-like DNA-binding protein
MTYQTSTQALQHSAVAIVEAGGGPGFQDLLAQLRSLPPAGLTEARSVIARLAEAAGAQGVIAPPPAFDARDAAGPDLGGLPMWKARRVTAHIEASLGEMISNADLARTTNLSVSYFCRAFKKTFGETAHHYVRRRRVALAQTLMIQSRQALAEIALACGFADQAHLTRVFGRMTGKSPSVWRRENAPLYQ